MKSFFKTIVGKCIIIALCTLSIICFIVSGCLAVYFDNYETINSSELKQDVISKHLDDFAYDIVYCSFNDLTFNGNNYLCYQNYKYEIVDKNMNVKYFGDDSRVLEDVICENYSYKRTFTVDSSNNIYWNYKPDDIKTHEYQISVDVAQIIYGYKSLNSIELNLIDIACRYNYLIYPIVVLSFIVSILTFIVLMHLAGRRNNENALCPSIVFVIPFDVACIGLTIFILFIYLFALKLGPNINGLNAIVLASIISVILFIALCMEASSRIKRHQFLSTLLSYRILKICFNILLFIPKELFKAVRSVFTAFRKYSIVKRICFILTIFLIAEYSILNEESRYSFWFIRTVLLVPLIIYITICFKKIKDGVNTISNGNLDYKIDTKNMHGDLYKLADQINNISSGMSKAVDEKLRSERMKTELITNVSHDIKTPLTSIINYTDLISKEKASKKVKEYSEVLSRQANKLKRLTDDLIEVTKANTGNIEVNLQEVDVGTLLSQVSGEYEDKIKNSDLILITALPNEKISIMADPRRLWRVFDNLMNNICKYSQANTRVYISCKQIDEFVSIYFKNTSKDSLNISAQELKERFVRGESSRNTEGNGLGLSIAESLTELQGGKFDIQIDGDLFKAIVKFKRKG